MNMTDSAVRITQRPSGIVSRARTSGPALRTGVKAMAYLRAKLYDAQLQKQNDELASETEG